MAQFDKATLRRVLRERLSFDELQDVAHDLEIDYEGKDKGELVRTLSLDLDRRRKLDSLVTWIKENREDVYNDLVLGPKPPGSGNTGTPGDDGRRRGIAPLSLIIGGASIVLLLIAFYYYIYIPGITGVTTQPSSSNATSTVTSPTVPVKSANASAVPAPIKASISEVTPTAPVPVKASIPTVTPTERPKPTVPPGFKILPETTKGSWNPEGDDILILDKGRPYRYIGRTGNRCQIELIPEQPGSEPARPWVTCQAIGEPLPTATPRFSEGRWSGKNGGLELIVTKVEVIKQSGNEKALRFHITVNNQTNDSIRLPLHETFQAVDNTTGKAYNAKISSKDWPGIFISGPPTSGFIDLEDMVPEGVSSMRISFSRIYGSLQVVGSISVPNIPIP